MQPRSGCISCRALRGISYRKAVYHACEASISFSNERKAEAKRMPDNKLVDLSLEFAKHIVTMVDGIKIPKSSYMLDQLARSGTSIGANIHEAQYAHSRADFVAKFEIALKEANETGYWLRLLYETGRISEEEYKKAEKECGNIRRMLIASCNTAKSNQ